MIISVVIGYYNPLENLAKEENNIYRKVTCFRRFPDHLHCALLLAYRRIHTYGEVDHIRPLILILSIFNLIT